MKKDDRRVCNPRIASFLLILGVIITCIGFRVNSQEFIKNFRSGKDTVEITLLLNKAQNIRSTNADSAMSLAGKALNIGRQLNNNRGIARSLYLIGSYYFDKKKQPDKALSFFEEALPHAQLAAQDDPLLTPQLFNAIGSVCLLKGNYDSAFAYYYRSLEKLRTNKCTDTTLWLQFYANISSALILTGRPTQALFYLQKSTAWALQRKDTPMLVQNFHSLGVIFDHKNRVDSAIRYWEYAARLLRATRSRSGLQREYTSMGIALMRQQKLVLAKRYFDSAVIAFPEGVTMNADLQQGIGSYYYYLKDYDQSIPYYKRSLTLHNKQGMRQYQLYAYWALSDMYSQKGQYSKAFTYQRAHSLLMDSLQNEKIATSISEKETRYQVAEKDKQLAKNEILLLSQQNRLKSQYLLILALFAGCLLFLSLLVILLRQKKHKAEVRFLKATIAGEEKERTRLARELHDGIVSRLSAIKMCFSALPARYPSISGAGDFNDALEQLEQSITELRSTSHNLLPEVLIQLGLIEALRIYCYKTGQNSRLGIELMCLAPIPPLKPEFELGIYRILQELIQNIIKHSEATDVLLQFNLYNNMLYITLDDNGAIPQQANSGEGIGLLTLRERIRLFGGTMERERRDDGTSLYLNFELKFFTLSS